MRRLLMENHGSKDFQSAIKKSTINNEFERVKRSETAAGRIFLTSSRQ
jgi:hypothetical protein